MTVKEECQAEGEYDYSHRHYNNRYDAGSAAAADWLIGYRRAEAQDHFERDCARERQGDETVTTTSPLKDIQ
jgi:hypothetical protein